MIEFKLLCFSVISISSIHTFSGPDHYLPFIVLSRSRKWSLYKTLIWTTLCGVAHVLGSVILGGLGIALSWTLSQTFYFEDIRGGFAAWLLLLFGICYTVYSIYRLNSNKIHKHFETSEGGELYVYEHQHEQVIPPNKRYKVTPWVMFFIFATGPSEPMIPLIIYPSINYSFLEVGILILLYTISTITTMLLLVLLGFFGSKRLNYQGFEKYTNILSGITITICGTGMLFLEW